MKSRFLLTILLSSLFINTSVFGQSADSTILKKFAYRVGNLAFAADSLELIIPDVPQGEKSTYLLEVYNFGQKEMSLSDAFSSRFVRSFISTSILSPATSATVSVEFDIVQELPLGPYRAEVSLDTDDPDARYKFLYLLTNIVPNTKQTESNIGLDTIPRLIFDNYNYNFGHQYRGKNIYISFVYTNVGGLPVSINRIEISPNCSLVEDPPTTIMPGERGIVRVKSNNKGCVGVQHRFVMIYCNDPVSPVITLGIHGSVKSGTGSVKNPGFCREGSGFF